jgi:hypothetical protein
VSVDEDDFQTFFDHQVFSADADGEDGDFDLGSLIITAQQQTLHQSAHTRRVVPIGATASWYHRYKLLWQQTKNQVIRR